MDKCAIVIVSFFPDERLLNSINELCNIKSVSDIYIVDNTEGKSKVIDSIEGYHKITIIKNNANKGVASAQNIGLKMAIEAGYSWALTLDHDTIIQESLFTKYFEYINLNNCIDVGIICSDYLDIGTGSAKFNNVESSYINETISSGSLINLPVFLKIGGMKEAYFIDQIDNEYCYRLSKNRYKIVLLPGNDMEHRLGMIEEKRFLGKKFYTYNQSPIRTYYRTRNIILFVREYNDDSLMKCKLIVLFKDLVRIAFEHNRLRKYYMFAKGIYAGFKYTLTKENSFDA